MAWPVPWLWLWLTAAAADFTARCPQPCECKWQSGNKAAACARAGLAHVPHHLSSEMQNLDLSENPLRQLAPFAFKRAGLDNLKKLVLRECRLEAVAESAFGGLGIVIELDMSRNVIRALHPNTFRETEKLRRINLSHNLLERLEDGLFRNLQYLQRVEMSDNRLTRISSAAFRDLPRLQILRLDSNNLTRLRPEALASLGFLSSLELHNNPWRCDCNLQPLRDWALGRNLYTPPTACAEPPTLRGRLWNELDSASFACRPTILEPASAATLRSRDENVTLTCKVVGNPSPELSWRFNARQLDANERRYAFSDGAVDLIRWLNVTILRARAADRGNYTCVAQNAGGRDERNVTLLLARYGGGEAGSLGGDVLAVLFGCASAALLACVALVTTCYCLARRRGGKRALKPDAHSPNGDAPTEDSGELEKAGAGAAGGDAGAAGDVNAARKPPAPLRYDAPSIAGEATTTMSHLNRTLIDSDGVGAHGDASAEGGGCCERRACGAAASEPSYPPDLLSFPPRLTARSPGSFVGYARFQSPLPPPPPHVRYATLPRRPRPPAWSEAPPAPLARYDELRARVSVDEGEETPSPAPGTPHAAASAARASSSTPSIHQQLLALHAITATSLALQHAYVRRMPPATERGEPHVGLKPASVIKNEPPFLESATQV